jgi:hypothetical protein
MRARLFPKNQEGEYLDPKEVVSRIATSMSTVLIDWTRGDQEVDSKLRELIALGTPDVILASHKSLFGRTVYIELSFPEFPNQPIGFFVQPYGRIAIESKDSAVFHHAVDQLSSLLNYDSKIEV